MSAKLRNEKPKRNQTTRSLRFTVGITEQEFTVAGFFETFHRDPDEDETTTEAISDEVHNLREQAGGLPPDLVRSEIWTAWNDRQVQESLDPFSNPYLTPGDIRQASLRLREFIVPIPAQQPSATSTSREDPRSSSRNPPVSTIDPSLLLANVAPSLRPALPAPARASSGDVRTHRYQETPLADESSNARPGPRRRQAQLPTQRHLLNMGSGYGADEVERVSTSMTSLSIAGYAPPPGMYDQRLQGSSYLPESQSFQPSLELEHRQSDYQSLYQPTRPEEQGESEVHMRTQPESWRQDFQQGQPHQPRQEGLDPQSYHHFWKSTPENEFQCTYPDCYSKRTYKDFENFQGHFRSHVKDVFCLYPGCDKVFRDKPHLEAHERSHQTNPRPLVPVEGLTQNNDHWGRELESGMWECVFPGCRSKSKFLSRSKWRDHFRSHEKKHLCTHPGCDKRFRSKAEMMKHLPTHFICQTPGCGQQCQNASDLETHTASHQPTPILMANPSQGPRPDQQREAQPTGYRSQGRPSKNAQGATSKDAKGGASKDAKRKDPKEPDSGPKKRR